METFIRPLVAAPFAVDDVVAGTRRDVTGGVELGRAYVRNHSRVVAAVAVAQVTEGLGFEVAPGQFPGRTEDEAGCGDVVNELGGVVKVGTPGDIPGEGPRTRAHRLGRPIHCRIPRRCAAAPGFTVETADVRCIFNNLAALSMG